MAAAGIVIGLVSGLLVVVYRLGIEYGTDASRWIYARIRETPWLIAPWAVAAVAAALAIAWMVGKEPMAGGSGIPQTNGVVICGLKMRWQTILPVRFVGGLLGALFGLSLGREGPSIQIGASGRSVYPTVCAAAAVRTCRSIIWSPPVPRPACPPRSARRCPA